MRQFYLFLHFCQNIKMIWKINSVVSMCPHVLADGGFSHMFFNMLMYGLPKTHKAVFQMRPILSSTATYNMA